LATGLRRKYTYLLVALVGILAVTYPVVYSAYAGTTQGSTEFSCPPLLPCNNAPTSSGSCSGFCIVYIENASFNPGVLNITEGTTVEWINLDPIAHTSTALNSSVWSSPIIPAGGHYVHTFSGLAAGLYYYQCNVHPFMTGEVRIVAPNQT
jgi:plastocyanin